MAFCLGTPKWESRNSQTWDSKTLRAHNFFCKPPIDMKSEAKWHATYTQGNRVDSRLLMVENQIANLTPGPSFDHNLCFKCPNGLCKPISDIYIPRAFQWYKERFNPMSFDPYNYFLKIQESTGTSTPKVGVPLGVWRFIPSHSFALPGAWNVTPGLPSWPALLQALALVANPRLRLRQKHCWEQINFLIFHQF
jgi:hypothetical protein